MFLGEDLLAWLVLALGGALFAGNLLAIVKPPERRTGATSSDSSQLARAPVARSLAMALLGLVAAIWALGSLVIG